MRKRRYYLSRKLYELCFRTKSGLPFPARPLIALLINSAMARTQRDEKVLICGHVWMANHAHFLVYSLDITNLKRFYEELKKRITDSVKRLLGLEHLSLWEDDASVIQVLDLETAIKRFVYIYSNPASAHLVDSIDEYPGVSSWSEFRASRAEVDACVEHEVPWVHMPAIPRIFFPKVFSTGEERRALEAIAKENFESEKIKIYPFAFLKAFEVRDPEEIEAVREDIIRGVKERQHELILARAREKKRCLGKSGLMREPLSQDYKPKKKERKILFLSMVKELRLKFLAAYAAFCEDCKYCYKQWKGGNFLVEWPLEALRPPPPAIANPI